MAKLEEIRNSFENNEELSLVPIKQNIFSTFINKLKKIFTNNELYQDI